MYTNPYLTCAGVPDARAGGRAGPGGGGGRSSSAWWRLSAGGIGAAAAPSYGARARRPWRRLGRRRREEGAGCVRRVLARAGGRRRRKEVMATLGGGSRGRGGEWGLARTGGTAEDEGEAAARVCVLGRRRGSVVGTRVGMSGQGHLVGTRTWRLGFP